MQEIEKLLYRKKIQKPTPVRLSLKNGFDLSLVFYQIWITVGILKSVFFLFCSIHLSLHRDFSFCFSLPSRKVILDRFPHSSPLQLFCNMSVALLLAIITCPNSSKQHSMDVQSHDKGALQSVHPYLNSIIAHWWKYLFTYSLGPCYIKELCFCTDAASAGAAIC